jgi:hypothetical protein
MMFNKILFAIDDNTDLHTVAKFMRHIDTARAMGTLKGSFVQCIGSWEGVLEASYLMDEKDYRFLVETLDFTKGQTCIMHVPGDTRQPCTLEYADKTVETTGPMKRVTKDYAMTQKGWTYVQSTNTYFAVEE